MVIMSNNDLYFWGMYKNKQKDEDKDNKIVICPKCKSKNIVKITALKPVFVELKIPYKCNDCGYEGEPKFIDAKRKKS